MEDAARCQIASPLRSAIRRNLLLFPCRPLSRNKSTPTALQSSSAPICGVHWQSDVDAGRLIGAAVVARLHADPVFRVQLD